MSADKTAKKEKLEELIETLRSANASTMLEMIQSATGKAADDACWIDGDRCNYGNPRGRLNQVSPNWCPFCQKLEDNMWRIEELFKKGGIREKIEENILEEARAEMTKAAEEKMQTVENLLQNLASNEDNMIKDFIKVVSKELMLDEVRIIQEEKLEEVLGN